MLHALFQLRLNANNPSEIAPFRSKLPKNAGRISSCTHFKLGENATVADLAKLRDICNLTSLQALDFDDFMLTDHGMAHLGNLVTLKRLDLGYFNQVTDIGLAHLGGLTALEHLHLWNEQVTDGGIAHISRLTTLRSLSIGGSEHVTDAGLAHLGRLTTLRSLSIGGSEHVTDAGLAHLGRLMSLRTLEIIGCSQMTDAGLFHLERLQLLERLVVCCPTQITVAGLARLQHSLVRQDKSGCSRELKGVHLVIARSSCSRLSGRRSNPSFEASKGEDVSRKY